MNALTDMSNLSPRLSGRQNHLLASLPPADYEHLMPLMQQVPLPLGKVIYEPGGSQEHVFFPVTGIVSKLWLMEDGSSAEIAVVGSEGMVGIALVLGGESMACRAVVQRAGYSYRLKASVLKTEFERGGAVQRVLLHYAQALMTQMSQTAVCSRQHVLEQQLCRLLLLSLDRLASDELMMTHSQIADRLGVRREGVAEAAAKLRAAGLISYKRGYIKVIDRAKLEARVCECYAAVKREYDRLLPEVTVTISIRPSMPPRRIDMAEVQR